MFNSPLQSRLKFENLGQNKQVHPIHKAADFGESIKQKFLGHFQSITEDICITIIIIISTTEIKLHNM